MFLKGAAAGAGLVLAGAAGLNAASRSTKKTGAIDDSAIKSVTLKITCTTRILKIKTTDDLRIWMPLPQNDRDQTISAADAKAAASAGTNPATPFKIQTQAPIKIASDALNNRMAYIEGWKFKEGDDIVLEYEVVRKTAGTSAEPSEAQSGYLARYLVPSDWEKWDDNIAAFVDKLVLAETDAVKIARKCYDAIIDRMEYIDEVCGRGVSALAFEDKTGRSDEYHALFRSMLMYKKIPVRWEQGLMLPYPSEMKKSGQLEADCISAHSWVRFYAGLGGWMPADLSEAARRPALRDFYFGRLAANRIKMSTGRGLTLNPPQKGIINTFPYTYIEANGYPFIYGHNYRNILKYELVGIEK
jgi:transglutaminase-like putative cysteine protease